MDFMASAKEKRQMMDFFVDRLRTASGAVVPASVDFGDGKKINYIVVDNGGAVLLVDRAYPNESFAQARKYLKQTKSSVATVFYKDEGTFFRSASRDNQFKGSLDFSLKKYTPEQIQRMITFRPEERYMVGRDEAIQYYQPKSDRLQEALATFGFEPVRFDYSHIDERERFKPQNRDSSKLFIWSPDEREELTGDIRLSENFLVS